MFQHEGKSTKGGQEPAKLSHHVQIASNHISFSISSCSSVLLTLRKTLSWAIRGREARTGGVSARTRRARSVICSSRLSGLKLSKAHSR